MKRVPVKQLEYLFSKIDDNERNTVHMALPLKQGSHSMDLDRATGPKGLVVSSDERVLQKLAKIAYECGLMALITFTVGESIGILDREKVSLVLCDHRLIDGDYEDILKATERLKTNIPVIVFSSTGDWPDYFRALSVGAFDYIAYPPFLGELPKVIHNALVSRMSPTEESATNVSNSSRES